MEIDSVAHMPWVHDTDEVVAEIQQFVTGRAPQVPSSRVLATVLMSDIVGSTARLAELGDTAWTGVTLVTATVRDLAIGSGIQFASQGKRELDGVPGNWEVFQAVAT